MTSFYSFFKTLHQFNVKVTNTYMYKWPVKNLDITHAAEKNKIKLCRKNYMLPPPQKIK